MNKYKVKQLILDQFRMTATEAQSASHVGPIMETEVEADNFQVTSGGVDFWQKSQDGLTTSYTHYFSNVISVEKIS